MTSGCYRHSKVLPYWSARLPDLKPREWHYIQRPAVYGIAGCTCGNGDPDWSEYDKHLWCAVCKKDFIPEHNGIFDGPVPIHASALMGISFDRINLLTGKLERFEIKELRRLL